MYKTLTITIVLALIAIGAAHTLRAQAPTYLINDHTAAFLSRTPLFSPGDEGSKFYRIPAIATLPDGSLLAVADKRYDDNSDLPGRIDVVAKRSVDNGATWSETITLIAHDANGGYGDPAVVVDSRSGDVIVVCTHGQGLWEATPDDHASIMVTRSHDNGLTWEKPVDITAQLIDPQTGKLANGDDVVALFVTSGHALQMSSGRLMFTLVVRDQVKKWTPLKLYALYSDDGGATWHLSAHSVYDDADESKVTELADGSLLMSIRNRRRGMRIFSRSTDGGATWQPAEHSTTLPCPACNGDMITLSDGTTLLHSIPDSHDRRENVSIYLSRDGGDNWQLWQRICPPSSAYSSLAELPDGTIAVFSEEGADGGGYRLWFTRLPKPEK